MRQLEQDVRGFWQYMDHVSGSNPEQSTRLAEAMVGREMNGSPLVPVQNHPIEGIGKDEKDRAYNQFTYDSDPDGVRCPFGAHIRRANPRNADFPNRVKGRISHLIQTLGFGRKGIRDDLMSPTRFHRLLRRGREYGDELSEQGLHFICLNGNIARQFEFVQGAWLMSTKFNGANDESDPLLGLTKSFSRPRENSLRERCNDLPQFVTVRGGAYFFLPSVRALRYFATIGS
jgi:deferrochelatase/peroxidase EfeB